MRRQEGRDGVEFKIKGETPFAVQLRVTCGRTFSGLIVSLRQCENR